MLDMGDLLVFLVMLTSYYNMYNFSKYINIKYKHLGRDFDGVDCYGLIKLIYKNEKGIVLPDYNYEENWYEKDQTIIQNELPNMKTWVRLKYPSEPFDLIIFYLSPTSKIANHIGLYTYDEKFLHTKEGWASHIERLNPHWQSRFYAALRYKQDGING